MDLCLEQSRKVCTRMRESLDEPVSIITIYNHKLGHFYPYQLSWQNQEYRLGKVDFWHKTNRGKDLLHHFSVGDVSGTMYFKLGFNTTNLQWVLEEYMLASEARVHYASWEAA